MLVNTHRDLVEDGKDGGFIVRPGYSRWTHNLLCGARASGNDDGLIPVQAVLEGDKHFV